YLPYCVCVKHFAGGIHHVATDCANPQGSLSVCAGMGGELEAGSRSRRSESRSDLCPLVPSGGQTIGEACGNSRRPGARVSQVPRLKPEGRKKKQGQGPRS